MLYSVLLSLFISSLSCASDGFIVQRSAFDLLTELYVHVGKSNWWTIRQNKPLGKNSPQSTRSGSRKLTFWMQIGREILYQVFYINIFLSIDLILNLSYPVASAALLQGVKSFASNFPLWLSILPFFYRAKKLASDVCSRFTLFISSSLGMAVEKFSNELPKMGFDYSTIIIIFIQQCIFNLNLRQFFIILIGYIISEKT